MISNINWDYFVTKGIFFTFYAIIFCGIAIPIIVMYPSIHLIYRKIKKAVKPKSKYKINRYD